DNMDLPILLGDSDDKVQESFASRCVMFLQDSQYICFINKEHGITSIIRRMVCRESTGDEIKNVRKLWCGDISTANIDLFEKVPRTTTALFPCNLALLNHRSR